MLKSEIIRMQSLWGTPAAMLGESSRLRRLQLAFVVAILFHGLPMLFMFKNREQRKLEPVVTLQSVDLIDFEEVPPVVPEVEKPKSALEFLKMAVQKPKAVQPVAPPPPSPEVNLAKPPDIKAPPPPIAGLSTPKTAAAAPDVNLPEIGRKAVAPPPVAASSISLDRRAKAANLAAVPSLASSAGAASAGSSPQLGYGAVGSSAKISLASRTVALPKPVVDTPIKKEVSAVPAKLDISKKKVEISGQLSSRKVLQSFVPDYPSWARARNIEADVVIRFTVNAEGIVKNDVVISRTSGYPELDKLAMQALLKWKFSPKNTTTDELGEVTFRYLLD